MQIVFIDGKNQVFRNYHTGKFLSRADGHPTGAIYGCLNNSMLALARRLPDASFVWIWEGIGETWRHRMMSQLPQLDSNNFPEVEIPENGEEEYDWYNANKVFSSSMINNSLEFLGVYKQPTKRKKPKTQGYKANRHPPVSLTTENKRKDKSKYPEDDKSRALIQMPILRLILETSGFRQFEVQGLEGDDLLAMLVRHAIHLDKDVECIILSGDRDYYQLLRYPQVKITNGLREGNINWITPEKVLNDFGVSPKDWTKYRAFTGDSCDNIPHVHKLGPKTALKMLAAGFNPSDASYRHIPKDAQEKFAKLFHPYGIARMWPAVYGNYKLCKLVTQPDDELLSEEVKEKLSHVFNKLTSIRKFQKRESCRTTENYRKMSFLLGQYELTSILAQRDLFWSIP
jgi:5'-3' exonuclease